MVEIITSQMKGKALKKDALFISAEARAAKQINPNVIDGTLGTFYFEDGSFYCHKTIKEMIASLNDKEQFLYSTSKGTDGFRNGTLKWLFQEYLAEVEKDCALECIPTPGGTGALTGAIKCSTAEGDTVLVPNPCWGPYNGLCESRGRKVLKYNLFEDNNFTLKFLKEKAYEILDKQNRLVVLLNDPCNNPTGYTMTEEEFKELFAFFNSLKDVPVVLIYDCAYIDMAKEGFNKTRKKLLEFKNANDNVMILAALSYSKTFFIYGQRLGSLVMISKNKAQVKEFLDAAVYIARNTWSNCNKSFISVIEKFNEDESLVKKVKKEIEEVVELLNARGELFIKEAKECGLEHYPYESGFFVSIPCKDSDVVLEKLKKEESIYLIPVAGGVRVAICSLPIELIKGLALKIKKCL